MLTGYSCQQSDLRESNQNIKIKIKIKYQNQNITSHGSSFLSHIGAQLSVLFFIELKKFDYNKDIERDVNEDQMKSLMEM